MITTSFFYSSSSARTHRLPLRPRPAAQSTKRVLNPGRCSPCLIVSEFARGVAHTTIAKTCSLIEAAPDHGLLQVCPPSRIRQRGVKIPTWRCFRTSSRFRCQVLCAAFRSTKLQGNDRRCCTEVALGPLVAIIRINYVCLAKVPCERRSSRKHP
jgi:hypothetical protein